MRIKSDTGGYLVEIASNDYDHLQIIAHAIGENYYIRRVSTHSNTYVITFCSKQMYQDIEAHGGSPRKSKVIGFPTVPHDLLPHFVRGVVDGDGTLSWNDDRPILQIYSGSQGFLNQVVGAITSITGIPASNISTNRENWYIKWSTIRAKCLAAWLYVDNSGLALARKSAVAAQFLEWQPKKRPEKGTITDEMRLNFSAYLPAEVLGAEYARN